MQASIPCQSARPVTAAPHRSLQQLSSRHTVAHALQPHCARQSRPARLACTPRAAGNFHTGVAAAGAQLKPELRQALDDFVGQNKIVLFMKGTQQFPQCGFSNTCVQIFHALGVPADQFTCVNILEDESLRSGLKEYSQVYIDGEFFGGCDIMIESYQQGELQEVVERVLNE